MRTTSKFLMAALLIAPFSIAAQTTGVNAESLEAKSYAASAMLSDQEAARRINLQQASQGQVAKLVEQYKDRLAGAYWEDEPELRFVIRLKEEQRVAATKVMTISGEVPVVIKSGAPNTIDELWKIVREHRQELYKTVPGLQGIFVDERTGEIVLHVHSGSGDKSAYSDEIASLRSVLQAPVRIDFLAGPMRPVPVA